MTPLQYICILLYCRLSVYVGLYIVIMSMCNVIIFCTCACPQTRFKAEHDGRVWFGGRARGTHGILHNILNQRNCLGHYVHAYVRSCIYTCTAWGEHWSMRLAAAKGIHKMLSQQCAPIIYRDMYVLYTLIILWLFAVTVLLLKILYENNNIALPSPNF